MCTKIKKWFVRVLYLIRIFLAADKIKAVVIVGLSLGAGLIPAMSAIVNASIINEISRVLTNASTEEVLVMLILFRLVLSIAAICTGNLRSLLIDISGIKVINCMRTKMCNKAKEIDVSDYDSPDYYSKLENAMQEIGTSPVSVLISMCAMVSGIVTISAYIAILCAFSLWVAILSVFFAIPEICEAVIFRRRVYEYNIETTTVRRRIGIYSKYPLKQRYIKEIKAYGLFSWFNKRYQEEYQKHFRGLKRLAVGEFTWETLANTFYEIVQMFLYVYILRVTIRTGGTIGSFVLYVGSLSSIASHVKSICGNVVSVYSSSLFIDNLMQFMNMEIGAPKGVTCVDVPSILESIEFRDVSFSYPGSSRKALDGVSFCLHGGDVVFLNGENGSGKTTILKLLLRFYEPDEGSILMNGVDIREFEADKYREKVSILFQEYEKYPETISQNVYFGDIKGSFDAGRYEEAIGASGAKKFIEKLPAGGNTPLTRLFFEDGAELSRGQWQKLSLARALYRESFLELYDEPTAFMDEHSTKVVMNELAKKAEGKIKIIVSHSRELSNLGNECLVLNNGKITFKTCSAT